MSDSDYFSSYGDLRVHELLLKDSLRVDAYAQAIEDNQFDFRDKIILDVGAGTGILSLLAARAGARLVFAVEACNEIADVAIQLIKQNHFEHVVTVYKSRVEDVLLPFQVDVIISEWMGFYLLHESMLNSVIVARDKWLKAQGKLYPSRARLYLAPCTRSIHQQNEMFWKNYYGFDFSIFDSYLKIMNERKPDIVLVATNELLAPSQTILDIDLKTVSLNDLRRLKRRCLFVAERSGPLRSYCCWFDVIFEGTRGDRTKQSFSLLFSAICVFVLA